MIVPEGDREELALLLKKRKKDLNKRAFAVARTKSSMWSQKSCQPLASVCRDVASNANVNRISSVQKTPSPNSKKKHKGAKENITLLRLLLLSSSHNSYYKLSS